MLKGMREESPRKLLGDHFVPSHCHLMNNLEVVRDTLLERADDPVRFKRQCALTFASISLPLLRATEHAIKDHKSTSSHVSM